MTSSPRNVTHRFGVARSLLIAIGLVALLPVAAGFTQNASFSVASFAAGASPWGLAMGDLNGDGNPDLAVANQSNSVSILLGTGTGAFSTPTNFAVGTRPFSVAIGDFNGDGRPDLAVANTFSDNVSILLGSGTGAFGSATNFAVGARPFYVAIGDFNGDGKSDLALANTNSHNVSILLGTGTGAFGSATNLAVGFRPFSVAIGDLNNDGKPDLVASNEGSNNVSVLLGAGAGVFGSATNFAVGARPYFVAIRDLDGDGKPDLAVANQASDNVSILHGAGTGTFGSANNFTVRRGPTSIAIGDYDGDGNPDLAVTNQGSANISILQGTGAGAFGWTGDFAVGIGPTSVATGHLNGDGKPDLAVANFSSSTVSILLNQTSPLPAAPTNLAATAVSGSESELSWSDNSGNETGFEVQRRTGTSSYGTVTTTGQNATSFADIGLSDCTTYTYRVRAVNAAGTSDFSGEATATTPDITPPLLTAPPAVTVECTGTAGQPVVLGSPVVSDACDPSPTVSNDAPALFSFGSTTVTWTARDHFHNAATATQLVRVVDTTPPTLTVPGGITVECTSSGGQAVSLGTASASDICGAVTVTNDGPALFGLGTTVVLWTATDSHGLKATGTQSVTVRDTTPPAFSVSGLPGELWPADHKMVRVMPTVTLSDVGDPSPSLALEVTSSEADDGLGDGDTVGDIVVHSATDIELRAERSGTGSGRTYTLVWKAVDASGNTATVTVTVTVPKSKGK